ncbi:MAG: glycosyltransferase family A protein [bacterium]|nr:glycosyltransferase family A protein [bacterium]
MTEKEYLEKVAQLRRASINNLERVYYEEMPKFADIRPYRLGAFALAAELNAKKGFPGEACRFLHNTFSCWIECDGLFEAEYAYLLAAMQNTDELDAMRHMLFLSELKAYYGKELSKDELLVVNQKKQELIAYYEFMLNSGFMQNIVYETKRVQFCFMEYALQQMTDVLQFKNGYYGTGLRTFVEESINIRYLKEFLLSSNSRLVIVSETREEFPYTSKISAKLCKELGHKVIYISLPQPIDVDYEVNWIDTATVCLEQKMESEYGTMITPIELILNGQSIGDNRDYILSLIADKELKEQHALFLTTGTMMDLYAQQPLLKKQLQRLSERTAPFYENTLQFGWLGNYLSYISDIYCLNVHEQIYSAPECRFSIIIPARNSSYTLRSTIQTCLEQTYDGNYEIIISDNSTNNNTEVYELIKELNHPKIQYIQTPRSLHLSKSFEYAFIHAKGEYILSLGSDDGMLPWALETIDKIAQQYPQEEIIQWERGFYAWPGFNEGQQHELVIPREYQKDDWQVHYKQRDEYLAEIFSNSQNMYSLPMLYINSCFKRSYFDTLLEKTGRLWDGVCQDIYMGVITASINNRILNLRYPLTIAGMSSGSVGANANQTAKTSEEWTECWNQQKLDGNVGGYCRTSFELLLPMTGTDTWSLYTSMLRAITIGVLPEEYIDELFDWKKVFVELYKELDIRDFCYDRLMQEMRACAQMQGETFLEWFDHEIYSEAMKPRYMPKNMLEKVGKTALNKRAYEVGRTSSGGCIVDASEFGVSNILGAVTLFGQLIKCRE